MTLLTLFWIWSSAACGLALAMLALLIVYRWLTNRRAQSRRLKRAHYVELLKAGAEGEVGASDGTVDILTDLVVEILDLVRGEEKRIFAERVIQAGVTGRLQRRLESGNVRTRILAASSLANFADDGSIAALRGALADRHRQVPLTAALSLAAIGKAPPTGQLVDKLGIGSEEAPLIVIMLLFELARTDLAGVRALLTDQSIGWSLRTAAAQALARRNDFASVGAISALAMKAEPSELELAQLLDALARLKHPEGSKAVLHHLRSPLPTVRAAATRAAGRIGVVPAMDQLECLLDDPHWAVRLNAAEALVRFGNEGKTRLAEIAERQDGPRGEMAALTLAEHSRS
ncbi:MAG: HEAT repeat domain-containing protein [Sphingomicrobium sp.]